MRTLVCLLILSTSAVAVSACGGVDYRDTNPAVDARPECASGPQRPGETSPDWCKRETGARWSTERKGEKVDFKTKDD